MDYVIGQAYGLGSTSLLVRCSLRLCSPTGWYCWLDSMFRQSLRQGFTVGQGLWLCSAIRWDHRLCSKVGWGHRLDFVIR